MSLYKFIEKKLPEVGLTMKQLAENEGINYTTINRIKAGGTILDGTKQKLAKGLKCSIGDINAAIAQLDDAVVEQQKTVVEQQKVPIKWYVDQKVEDEVVVPDEIPRPGLTKIPDVNVEMYKQHLMDKLITLIAQKRNDVQLFEIYAAFGEEVAKELFRSRVYVAGI